MARATTCPDCGTELSSDRGTEGLCPRCLLSLALVEFEAGVEDLPTLTLGGTGRILGQRYQLREFLGRGGMGEVWRAFDLKLRVDVALKFIRKEHAQSEKARELLRQEVRAARQVVSPNVCRIYDLVVEDGEELVSMEYIDGTTLAATMQERGPLGLEEAREIASQFLLGLEAIHQAGLVHRDFKPENVMLTRAGRVVVMDFGLAKRVTESGTGSLAGTVAYMAPEQGRGDAVDARADVFAAGIVLAEMLATGGDGGQARQRLFKAVRETPPQVPEGPWTPILRQALSADPGGRQASAGALARALEEITLRLPGFEQKHPYPGLASFTEEDAEFFFGREVEVEALWRKIKRPRLLALIGPSGAGKSSFLRAGLLPALPSGWKAVLVTPGNRPFRALAQALVPELSGDAHAMQSLLGFEDPETAVDLLSRWRQRHEQALIIVDQFEELFTINPPEIQTAFAALLGRLVLEADTHVLLSLRDDFLIHCHAHSALNPILSELSLLGPLGEASLRRALVQPALRCGYRFEDDALVEEILRELGRERGALPLVAFAMAQLWERRDRERGLLIRQAYEEIGGVGGALAQHAEATLEQIGAERQPIVREIFRNLVTAQGTRAARDREELLSVFPDLERAEEALRGLVDARLLTSFEVRGAGRDEGQSRHQVEIVHESLLTAWPRLVRWRTQDADGALLRDQLRQTAKMWEERGRPNDLLWTGASYREFRVWRERYPGGLSSTEGAFAITMVDHAERRRRRQRLGVAAAFVLLIGVVGVVGWYGYEADRARQRAEASRLFALGQLEIEGNPTRALAFAIASLERADHAEVRRFAMDAIGRQPMVNALARRGGFEVDFSPDGRWLARADRREIVLFGSAGGPPRVFKGDGGAFNAVKFGAGSDVLLSSSQDSTAVQAWSIPDGRLIRSLEHGSSTDEHRPLFMSADRRRLITAVLPRASALRAGRAQLLSWTPERSEPDALEELQGVPRWGFAVDASGDWLAYIKDGRIYLGPFGGFEKASQRLVGRHAGAYLLSFSPNGRLLATVDEAGGFRVWSLDAETQTPYLTFDGEDGAWVLDFDRAGTLLASGHRTGTIRLWDLKASPGLPPMELRGRTGSVVDLAVHPNGHHLVSGSQEARLGLWPIGSRYPRVPFRTPVRGINARGVAFGPDGRWIVVTMGERVLRLLPLSRAGGEPLQFELSGVTIENLSIDQAGRRVLTGTSSGVDLVDLETGRSRRLPGSEGMDTAVAISPDGRLAAGWGRSGGMDCFIRVWDLDAGTFQDLGVETDIIYLSFLPDARLLFVSVRSGGPSGPTAGPPRLNVYCWTVGEGRAQVLRENIVTPNRSWAFDLSRDGSRVLLAGVEHALMPPGPGGDVPRVLEPESNDCKYNKAGTLVVCGTWGGAVRVLPLDGRPPRDLVGHEGKVGSVAISPDDRWIASTGYDGTLRLWPMPDLDEPPPLTLPYDEFLDRLRSMTNERIVPGVASPDEPPTPEGWKLEYAPPQPGWETEPTW